MDTQIRIDDKWLNVMQEMKVYYLTPDEQLPHRNNPEGKRFMKKVKCICAFARQGTITTNIKHFLEKLECGLLKPKRWQSVIL